MKLIIAIISNDDSYDVLSELTKAGFDATKLSTTGGFLSAGNVTLLIGVEDSRVDDVMEILRENCSRRTHERRPRLQCGELRHPARSGGDRRSDRVRCEHGGFL